MHVYFFFPPPEIWMNRWSESHRTAELPSFHGSETEQHLKMPFILYHLSLCICLTHFMWLYVTKILNVILQRGDLSFTTAQLWHNKRRWGTKTKNSDWAFFFKVYSPAQTFLFYFPDAFFLLLLESRLASWIQHYCANGSVPKWAAGTVMGIRRHQGWTTVTVSVNPLWITLTVTLHLNSHFVALLPVTECRQHLREENDGED